MITICLLMKGLRKRKAHQREGKALHGVEEHSGKAAWTGNPTATCDLQGKSKRKDSLDEENAWRAQEFKRISKKSL